MLYPSPARIYPPPSLAYPPAFWRFLRSYQLCQFQKDSLKVGGKNYVIALYESPPLGILFFALYESPPLGILFLLRPSSPVLLAFHNCAFVKTSHEKQALVEVLRLHKPEFISVNPPLLDCLRRSLWSTPFLYFREPLKFSVR